MCVRNQYNKEPVTPYLEYSIIFWLCQESYRLKLGSLSGSPQGRHKVPPSRALPRCVLARSQPGDPWDTRPPASALPTGCGHPALGSCRRTESFVCRCLACQECICSQIYEFNIFSKQKVIYCLTWPALLFFSE